MLRQLRVSTGARLHCGLLAHGGETGRQFGGVGLMVDAPGFVVRASRADRDEVLGASDWERRLLDVVTRYRREAPATRQPPPVRLELDSTLPAHSGLGSGTQLALAAAAALALFAGETDVSAAELARRAGRGGRSAVGLYGFSKGGLLIEAGKRSPTAISPLFARADVPPQWRFVLLRPRGTVGLSGAEERQGFARLPPMPAATTDRLCRLALLDLFPSVLETDFEHCAAALAEFGRLVGNYFAPVQGGVYADPQMRMQVERLHSRGVRGVCQSSWGPTLFALCPDASAAESLVSEIASESDSTNLELTIAQPLNRGAKVEVLD